VVPRPLQHVHRQERRVGHLQEEDALARNRGDAGGVVLQRERVETVEDEAQVRMVGSGDDLPRLAVQAHVAAPRQRLVADAQIPLRRALGERVQLRRRATGVVDRQRRGVRADQHQRRAERLHQVELALGPVQALPEGVVGHAFEVAERAGTGRCRGRDPRPWCAAPWRCR
jgi:hypothetical protein